MYQDHYHNYLRCDTTHFVRVVSQVTILQTCQMFQVSRVSGCLIVPPLRGWPVLGSWAYSLFLFRPLLFLQFHPFSIRQDHPFCCGITKNCFLRAVCVSFIILTTPTKLDPTLSSHLSIIIVTESNSLRSDVTVFPLSASEHSIQFAKCTSRMIRSDLFWYWNNVKIKPTYRGKTSGLIFRLGPPGSPPALESCKNIAPSELVQLWYKSFPLGRFLPDGNEEPN